MAIPNLTQSVVEVSHHQGNGHIGPKRGWRFLVIHLLCLQWHNRAYVLVETLNWLHFLLHSTPCPLPWRCGGTTVWGWGTLQEPAPSSWLARPAAPRAWTRACTWWTRTSAPWWAGGRLAAPSLWTGLTPPSPAPSSHPVSDHRQCGIL